MKTKTTKITGIFLTLLMLVIMIGALSLTADAADGLTVTVDSAIAYGTVTASPTSAAAGDTVTLTVTPDDGYSLVPGTLKVSYGASEIKLTPDASGTCIFTMPGANATVSARFGIPNGEVYYINDSENGVTRILGNGAVSAGSWQNIIMSNVVIEEGVTTIDASAFRGLSSLESITIPASVESIGRYAFQGCASLCYITYLGTIEPTVYSNTFDVDVSVSSVIVPTDYTGTTFANIPVEKSITSTSTYAASLTTVDATTTVTTYYVTLEEAIAAAKSIEGSTVKLHKNVQFSTDLEISEGKFTIDLNGHTLTGTSINNSGELTLTGSGSYNGNVENRGRMFIGANVGGDVEAYEGKLTVIGGTVQSLVVYGEDVASLKGGTFDNLKMIIENPGPGISTEAGTKFLNKLLAYGKLYSHYDTEINKYDAEGKIVLFSGGDIVKIDAWFVSPVTVIEDDPVIPTVTAEPVDNEYTVIETAEALSVGATNKDDGGTLSYQWYSDTDGDAIGGTAIAGATDATYTPATDAVGTFYYYCVVTNSKTGFEPKSITSQAAKVTVTKATLTKADVTLDGLESTYDLYEQHVSVVALPAALDGQYVTVGYMKNEYLLPSAPSSAGEYTVVLSVKDSPNYEDVDLYYDMVINVADVTVHTMPGVEYFYNGGAHTPSVSVTLNNGLPFDPTEYGGTVSYSKNINAGIAEITVGGNFRGSCTFEIKKATPTITVSAPLDKVMPGYVMNITATTSAIDNFINATSFTVEPGEGYTTDGVKITVNDDVVIGSTITVRVSSTETENYEAAEGELVLTVDVTTVDMSAIEDDIASLREQLDTLDDTYATNADVSSKIDAIQSQIDALDAAYATNADILAIQSEIDSLKNTLATKAELNAAIDRLEGLINSNSVTVGELDSALAELELALGALDNTYAKDTELTEAIELAISTVELAIDKLENEIIPEIKEDILENTGNIGDLESSLGNVELTLDNISSAINELSLEDDRLTALISSLDTELDTLSASLDSLTGRVDTAEDEINALKSDLIAKYSLLTDLINDNASDIGAINDTLDSINSILYTLASRTEVEDEIGILNSLIDSLTDSIIQNESNINTNSDAISALNSTVRALQSTVSAQGAELAGNISALSTVLTVLETRVVQNEQAIAELGSSLDKAIYELNNAIAAGNSNVSEELEALKAALDKAKATLNAQDAINKTELLKKINEAESTLRTAVDKVAQDLETLKSALSEAIAAGDAELLGKITELSGALEDAKRALEAADKESSDALSKKIDEAKKALDEAIKSLEKDLTDLRAELEAKDRELVEKDLSIEEKADKLNTFITIVCIIASLSLCATGAFVAWFFIYRNKKM